MEMLQRLWIALFEEIKLKKKKREKEEKVCGQVVTEIVGCCQGVTVFRIPQRPRLLAKTVHQRSYAHVRHTRDSHTGVLPRSNKSRCGDQKAIRQQQRTSR